MMKALSRYWRFFIFLLCVAVCGAFAVYVLHTRYLPLSYTATVCRESSASLPNPYRGFYHLYGYALSEESTANTRNFCLQLLDKDDCQLVLLQINMKNYRTSDLSIHALEQLDVLLHELTSADKQLILRFIYDWDGKGLISEPSSREQIATHMTQVATIVNNYKSHIFLLQGIFTGNYGEMNNTSYGTQEDCSFLMNHLASVIHPDIFLSVRTPAQWRGIIQSHTPLAGTTPFSGILSARMGLYNDGMLGSVYDLGTYDDSSYLTSANKMDAGTREEELAFQQELCLYVPNGGEVVIDNTYNDIPNAIYDLAMMHVSYLNRDYDGTVLDKWKHSTYNDMNGFDYIEAHLGYRYVLADSEVSFHPLLDESATLQFTVENVGFAPAYRQFTWILTLEHQDTGTQEQIVIPFDNRSLHPDETLSIPVSIPVRTMESGTYHLSLVICDPSTSLPVYLANEHAEKTTKLGTLTIP